MQCRVLLFEGGGRLFAGLTGFVPVRSFVEDNTNSPGVLSLGA
jgi:hypothetical protein